MPNFQKAQRNGRRLHKQSGYVFVKRPQHPKADAKGLVQEHRIVVEDRLGKHLPDHAIVHHVNGNRKHNNPDNLVVCPNDEYHMLLHARAMSYYHTGSPNNRWCSNCHSFKPMDNFCQTTRRDKHGNQRPTCSGYCIECNREANRKSYERNKTKILARQKKKREQDPETYRYRARMANRKRRQEKQRR